MGENQKSNDGILEKLALITDATQTLFPEGKSLILFELDYEDFKKVQTNFRKIDQQNKKFTIDISGVEVVFILEGYMEEKKEEKITEPLPKRTVFQKLLDTFRIRSKSPI
jgi:hypothetical protein